MHINDTIILILEKVVNFMGTEKRPKPIPPTPTPDNPDNLS